MQARLLPPLLFASLAFGCIEPPIDDEVADVTVAVTYEAAIDDANTPAANATVYFDSGAGGCTGTLITPTKVLTAGHCGWPTVALNEPLHIKGAAVTGNRLRTVDAMRRIHEIRLDGDTYRDWPWLVTAGFGTSVQAAAGRGDALYVVAGNQLYRGSEAGGWVVDGSAYVASLAVGRTTLTATTPSGSLWRRLAAPGSTFAPLGYSAPTGGGLAVDVDDRVYVAQGGRVRVRVDGAWRDVGPAPGALFGNGDFLFARDASNQVWMRRAVPWQEEWRNLGAGRAGALAATGLRLHSFEGASRRSRDAYRHWREVGTTPVVFDGLAISGADMFAIGDEDDRGLWVKTVDGSEAWTRLGNLPPASFMTFTELTASGGQLFAVTSAGVFTRPANRTTSSLTWTRAAPESLTVTSIGAIGGDLFAIAPVPNTTLGMLHRRLAGSTEWTQLGTVLHQPPALVSFGGDLMWAMSAGAKLYSVTPSTSPMTTKTVPSHHWQSPLIAYQPPPQSIEGVDFGAPKVWFGNDAVRFSGAAPCPSATCKPVAWYWHSTESDAMILELSEPVAPSVAVPSFVMTSRDPRMDIPSELFTVKGWGGRGLDVPMLKRWNGTSWSSVLTMAFQAVDISYDGGTGAILDIWGKVYVGDNSSWTYTETQVPGAVAVEPFGAMVLVATPTDVRAMQGPTVVTTYTPPLQAGEAIVAFAREGAQMRIYTNQHRMYLGSTTGGTFTTESNGPPFISLAADGSTLWGLTAGRNLYRKSFTGGTWVHQGSARGVDSIGARWGTLSGIATSIPRFRQLGAVWSAQWPYPGDPVDPGRLVASGAGTHPGDSGGSLFWDDPDGLRWLVGVTQGGSHGSTRQVVTWAESATRTDGSLVVNLGKWIPHVMLRPPTPPPVVIFPPPAP